MRRLPLCLALLLAILASHVVVARAEDGPKDYRVLIDSALEEYGLGNYEEALSLFERAHAIEPSARTLRGMGMASYQARKYVLALGYLEGSLSHARKPLTPQFRREVQHALEATRGFIVRYELVIAPANANVTVDGEPVSASQGQLLQLDPGEHEVVASAPGYKTDTRRIKATSGRAGRIELRLQPEQAAALAAQGPREGQAPPAVAHPRSTSGAAQPALATSTSTAVQPAPVGIKALTITGLSVALVAGALGAGAGITALKEEDQLATKCPEKRCDSEYAGQLKSAKRWGTISTASLAVGGAGLVAGLVGVLLWVRHKRAEERTRESARLSPVLFASGVGLRGSF